MTTWTVTARGQVTFRKQILEHLGIRPGDRLRLDLLPDGRAEPQAERSTKSWRALHGFSKGKGNGAQLSIEEIGDATADAGAAAWATGLRTT